MTLKLFLRQILLLSALLMALAILITRFQFTVPLFWLYLLGTVTFVLFSVFIFFYAMTTSRSDYLFSFNNVVIASFLIKLLMVIGFLMAFDKYFTPQGDSHILHYLFLYVVFTAYEVYFLTRLARRV